jgi:putative acetyltransferase
MHTTAITIRTAHTNDLPEIQNLFVETINAICYNDYTPEQIKVWTSAVENQEPWLNKLKTQYFIVAEADGKIAGFASLQGNDYLDFLYIHKDYQRQGIASKLYNKIENEAIRRDSAILRSDVSKTAKLFFEQKGFKTTTAQTKNMKGVNITNFIMTKQLHARQKH